MTPAKALILSKHRRTRDAYLEQPIAQIAMMFWNANRSPGDEEKGVPAEEARPISDFLMFRRPKLGPLESKGRPGGDHVLLGAKADISGWVAWAKGKTGK